MSETIHPGRGERPKERDIFGREPVGYPDWSHRRGEPRVFALIWMLYLMGVTIVMFAAFTDALSISTSVTRPAARKMLVATAVGIGLLWPAIRLSQRASRTPTRDVLRDLFVLLVPAQAMIWPHAMGVLARWPIGLLAAVSASLAAWGLVVGGLIAWADAAAGRDGRGRGRWAWMLGVLIVVLGAPAWAAATGRVGLVRADLPRPAWMLSPVTAVYELVRDRDSVGMSFPVHGAHWRMIGATACVGGALLLVARAVEVASRRRGA